MCQPKYLAVLIHYTVPVYEPKTGSLGHTHHCVGAAQPGWCIWRWTGDRRPGRAAILAGCLGLCPQMNKMPFENSHYVKSPAALFSSTSFPLSPTSFADHTVQRICVLAHCCPSAHLCSPIDTVGHTAQWYLTMNNTRIPCVQLLGV